MYWRLPAFLDYIVFKNTDTVIRNDLWQLLPNVSSFVYFYMEKQKDLFWLGVMHVGMYVYMHVFQCYLSQ